MTDGRRSASTTGACWRTLVSVASHLVLCVLILALQTGVCAFSLDKEIKLGEQVAKEAEKEMPLSKNEKWQRDVQDMGNRLSPIVNRTQIRYHFRIVAPKDTSEINAFALPGGYVYFTERMWRIMTPDERAAVMAHEIVHCDRRHGVDMMLKSQQRALWLLPLIIASGGGALAQAAMWGNAIVSQRYSRKMEREADEQGIRLLKAAGFNPAGSVTAMKKLLNIESNTNRYEVSAVFAGHPDTQKRVDYLTKAAMALGAKPAELELKVVDDPSRLGNVTSKVRDANVVNARTLTALDHGEPVLIKKMLWDDDANALAPKTVATAVVLTPGTLPMLVLEDRESTSCGDVMPGDGVYPAQP